MTSQLFMDSSTTINTYNGSEDQSPMQMRPIKLYHMARHRQRLLYKTQEDLRKMLLNDGLVRGVVKHLKEIQKERIERKRRAEEEKLEVVKHQIPAKKVKVVEMEVAKEEKKWNAHPVESKKIKKSKNTEFEDPFGMDDLFSKLEAKK